MHFVHMLFWDVHTFLFLIFKGDTAMCKRFRHFIIMLTAISVMLTMTVSPVMGEQYSDDINLSLQNAEDTMWEEAAAEIETEAVDEYFETEAESPTPDVCAAEMPIQEALTLSEERSESCDRIPEPLCEGWTEEQQSCADVCSADEQEGSRAYLQDEERFARYYEGLKEFDAPSEGEGRQEEDEELVGANTPSAYITSRLTPVRDQGYSGLCWAFSTAAILEASLLQRYTDENKNTLDLSEEQLAYFYFNRQDDPLHNTGDMQMIYQDSDEATAYRYASGSPIYLLQELSTGQGIAKESDVPFYLTRRVDSKGNVSYKESSAVPSKSKAYLSYAGLDSYETFEYSVDKVKKEIMENGAVAVSMYYENASRNLSTNGYYDSNHMRSNHVVTLVGWDDTFAVSKFNSSERPKRSGAWIAKNSWGDDWGDGGYFYISYENATMLGCVSVSAVKSAQKKYPNLYFYDGLAMVGNSIALHMDLQCQV